MFIQISDMFSQTAEYALRAVVWLASHTDLPLTNDEIATATQVPSGYLSKVLQALGRSGLVQAQRGKHGGFTLTRAADTITILDVVNAVDPIQRIRTCPLGLKAHSVHLCPLHRRLDDAFQAVEATLGGAFISELLAVSGEPKPLCDIAEAVHA